MTVNPYESPQAIGPKSPSHLTAVRVGFFAVNLVVVVMLLASTIVSVAVPVSPFAFLGGIVMFGPVAVYGVGEWIAFFRQSTAAERILGWANLGGAGIVAFGILTNTVEALRSEKVPIEFLVVFLSITVPIVAYWWPAGHTG